MVATSQCEKKEPKRFTSLNVFELKVSKKMLKLELQFSAHEMKCIQIHTVHTEQDGDSNFKHLFIVLLLSHQLGQALCYVRVSCVCGCGECYQPKYEINRSRTSVCSLLFPFIRSWSE